MDTVVPKLHVSPPEPLGFGPSLEIRAYLLERPDGNVVIYRSARLRAEVDAIRRLGGISRQYLNHHHEASPECDWVTETFGAPLHVHAADAPHVAAICTVGETFTTQYTLGGDLEIIPAPGHTDGATVYLWDTGEHRVLFTGDTIFFSGGRWRAALLDGVGDRERHIESLRMIQELDFDLVVPGIAPAGQPAVSRVNRSEARQHIDGIIERLWQGFPG